MARIEITEEHLDAKLAAAAKAGAEAAIAGLLAAGAAEPKTTPKSDEEDGGQYAQILKMLKGRPASEEPEPIPCKSHTTGSTFRARLNGKGIVLDLLDYEYPVGIDKHIEDGGLVPERAPIFRNGVSGELDADYKHWRYTEFRLPDLRAYVGKPLPKHVIAPPAAAE